MRWILTAYITILLILIGSISYASGTSDATFLMYENRWDRGVAIVSVVAGGDNPIYTYGTGFWVAENILVTARHVVIPNGIYPDRITIIKGHWSSAAEVLYDNELTDIAILRVDTMPDEYFIFPLDQSVEKGKDIMVIGYPWQVVHLVNYNLEVASLYPRANWGKITWIHPINNYVVEFSAGTDQGNSGGPVIDVQTGGVVGVVSFALDDEGIEYSTFYLTSSSEIVRALEELGINYVSVDPLTINLRGLNIIWVAAGTGLLFLVILLIVVSRRR